MKIKKIRHIGKEEVYDIKNIQDNHNFIANGIIVHNCDESIKFALSSEWAKRENRELRKKLAVIRTKHLFFIMCFPFKIQKIEKSYLDSLVNYWVDLFGRGVGSIYIRDKNPVNDSWRLKEFGNVGSYTEFTALSKVEKALRRHPNFWQIIKFPKPSDKLYKEYLSVRESNVYDDDSVLKNVSKEDINNALLVMTLKDIMEDSTTHTMNRVLLHIKNKYDINLSRQNLQTTIEDARQLVQKLREKALTYEHTKTQLEISQDTGEKQDAE